MTKSGTYTGNGADNRNIDIGVDWTIKKNCYVIIKGVGALVCCQKFDYGQGELTWYFTTAVDQPTDSIQAFVSVGFQIGTHASVNTNAVVYRYIVFWEEP